MGRGTFTTGVDMIEEIEASHSITSGRVKRANLRPGRLLSRLSGFAEQLTVFPDHMLQKIRNGLDATCSTQVFMPCSPVGSFDTDVCQDRYKIVAACDHEVVQDAYSGTGGHRLDLTDRGRQANARPPTGQNLDSVIEFRRVDQIVDIADQVMMQQIIDLSRHARPCQIA